jgi:hypothetical protein
VHGLHRRRGSQLVNPTDNERITVAVVFFDEFTWLECVTQWFVV